MTESVNPHALFDDAVYAAQAPASERAVFLKKVYGLLTLGLLVFAGVLWLASIRGGPLEGAVAGVARIGWIGLSLGMMGLFWVVRAVARKPVVNVAVYLAVCGLLGLMLAPLVYIVAGTASGTNIIAQAAVITAVVFVGLSAFVFWRGADFGFLGGFLTVLFLAIVGIGLVSMFTSIQLGTWFSALGVLLYSGFILYDTSNIMKRHPVDEPTSAAIELFADVALLFQWLLGLISRFDD